MNKKFVLIILAFKLILSCKSSFASWNSIPEGDFRQLHLLLESASDSQTGASSIESPSQDEKIRDSNSLIRVETRRPLEQMNHLSTLYSYLKINPKVLVKLNYFPPLHRLRTALTGGTRNPLDVVSTLDNSDRDEKGSIPPVYIFSTEDTSITEFNDWTKRILESQGPEGSEDFLFQTARLIKILGQTSFNWDQIVIRYINDHLISNPTNPQIEKLLNAYEKEVLESKRERQLTRFLTQRYPSLQHLIVGTEEKTGTESSEKLALKIICDLLITSYDKKGLTTPRLPSSIPPYSPSLIGIDSNTKLVLGSYLDARDTTSLDCVHFNMQMGSIPQGKKDLPTQLERIENFNQSYFRAISYLKQKYFQRIYNFDGAVRSLSKNLTQELRPFWNKYTRLGNDLDRIDAISGLKLSEVILLLRETLITAEDDKLFYLNLSTLLMRSDPERYGEVIKKWVVRFYYQVSSPVEPLRTPGSIPCLIM